MLHDIFCDNSWPVMLIFLIGQQWHKHLQKLCNWTQTEKPNIKFHSAQ
jgi:hypothetical protein